MKIKFLGTAASEGVPAMFCNCNICKAAKENGGKDNRTRNQILVDEDLLLDFTMDTYFHMVQNKLDLSKVKNICITHSHHDHCCGYDLLLHGEPYAYSMTEKRLNIFGNQSVIHKIKEQLRPELKNNVRESLTFTMLKSFETINLGDKTVTALPANHTKGEDCHVFLIEKHGKAYLQFNDSGILSDEVYQFLQNKQIKLDIISFDCTYGYFEKGQGRHMGVLDNANERTRMKAFDILKQNTKFVLTHFSHNTGYNYAQMQEKVKDMDFIVAYDGMEVEI